MCVDAIECLVIHVVERKSLYLHCQLYDLLFDIYHNVLFHSPFMNTCYLNLLHILTLIVAVNISGFTADSGKFLVMTTYSGTIIRNEIFLSDYHCPFPDLALTPSPGCSSDLMCPDNMVCYDRKCKDPCNLANPCAARAECSTRAHRPKCVCLPGYTGDPYTFCGTDVTRKLTHSCLTVI